MVEDGLFQHKYRIKSSRLAGWDYSAAGYYFVTFCTKDRVPFLGQVSNSEMILSPIGHIARDYWQAIPEHSPNSDLDEFVVMPDHIHGIIILNPPHIPVETLQSPAVETLQCNVDMPHAPVETLQCPEVETLQCPEVETLQCNVSTQRMSEISPNAGSLSAIVRSYKSAVTYWCRKNGWPDFAWQTRFYDRIIRDDAALQAARQYIQNNPLKWEMDQGKLENLWM